MDPLAILNTIILAITLLVIWYFSYRQVRELKKQIWINTFLDMTRRYQEIVSKIPAKYYNTDNSFNDEEIQKDMALFRSYFNLCSEEYILKESKYLKEEIWEKWLKEMKKLSSFQSFQKAWSLIRKIAAYDDDFIEFYNSLCSN